ISNMCVRIRRARISTVCVPLPRALRSSLEFDRWLLTSLIWNGGAVVPAVARLPPWPAGRTGQPQTRRDDTMTIDDRQELGSLYWCMGESPHARASCGGTDSLASIISSQDRTTERGPDWGAASPRRHDNGQVLPRGAEEWMARTGLRVQGSTGCEYVRGANWESKVLPLVNKIGRETTSQRTTDIRKRYEGKETTSLRVDRLTSTLTPPLSTVAWVHGKGAYTVDTFTMEFGPSLPGCEQLFKIPSRKRLSGIIYLPMVCLACYGDEEIKARLNN
ncbi:hypothetical protein THAOC_10606, partial [Thalassiosira oceanica]